MKMNIRVGSFALWIVCLLLFYPKSALAAPQSELQVSNLVLRALAIRYPALASAPQAFNTPFGRSLKSIKHVETLTRGASLVGYVVNLAPSGYYLLSTDDELPLWKLRSDNGNFANLPPGLVAVLKSEMAEDQQTLSALHKANKSPSPQFHREWQKPFDTGDPTNSGSGPTTGSPGTYLLQTTWNQDDPYNYYCPAASGGPGGRAYAGCTACALAQILCYHTQPTVVAQDHTDVDSWGAIQGSFSISSAGMGPYDWVNMPTGITDSSPLQQETAIGRLMYDAAVALDSDFETSDTSANPSLEVPAVLPTYFGYTCTSYKNQSAYSEAQWYSAIATEIDANRPVFYAMFEADGSSGHAVVCDGYQNGNEIHLNLGWSGSWDAWYNLDSVVASGYTWTVHGAIFGITPPIPVINSVSPGTLSPSSSPQIITISGLNFNFTGPNASKLVFNDPANNSTTVTPINPTATSLQYGLSVGSATGTWRVKVVNGALESAIYTFVVSSVNAQLVGLTVSGPANVVQNTSGIQYTAHAIMSDGSTPTVTPSWGVSAGAPASISSSGQLTASGVSANTPITVNASYTYGGVTKTANYNVTILASGNCGSYEQELISNGTFANGSTGWTLVGNFQADSRFSSCHSCPGYAYLANSDGSPGNNLAGTLSQTITIPSDATSATLGYYYYITTSDSLTTAYDYLYLNLVLSGGTLVGIDQKSNKDANSSYAYRSFDVTAYKGQTITIRFSATTDASGPTVFRVDDVSLAVSRPNPVVPALFGVGGPTSVAQGATAQYNAIVVNCDNSIQPVTPSWSVSSGPATISSSGLLTAGGVSADTPATVTSIYNNTRLDYPITVVHVAPVFTALGISGPNSVNENSSGQFTASAIFSDGSSQSVSPNWSVTSGPGNVSASGLLTIGAISANATTTISATYTIGNIAQSASQQLSVIYLPPPPTFTSLNINGPSTVEENSTAQYSATAWFSDNSSQVVTPTWNVNSSIAGISIFGLLTASEVTSNTVISVSASYRSGSTTLTASSNVTVLNASSPPATRIISMSGNMVFGNVTVGSSAQSILNLYNTGNSTLTVSNISYPDGFSGNWSGAIVPGGSQLVTVTFSPTSAIAYGGAITINSDATGGVNTTNASGTGAVASGKIISVGGDLAFGAVPIGSGVENLLTISNSGTGTLNISNLICPSGFNGSWSGSIAPASFTYVLITFEPTLPAYYGGAIVVTSDAASGTNTIAVSGMGTSTDPIHNPPIQLGARIQPGNALVMTWPTNAVGFQLEFATNLGPSAIWTPVGSAATVLNGQNVLTNSVTSHDMFFRLRQ